MKTHKKGLVHTKRIRKRSRLQKLKRQIGSGKYRITSEELAKALLFA